MTGVSPRRGNNRLGWLAIAVLALTISASGAHAQVSPECEKIGKLSKDRATTMMQIQSWQKAKNKPTAAAVCSAFSNLQANGNALIPLIEANGAWCHIPDNAVPGLKQQQAGIGKTRATACSAAAKMKKMEAQRAQGPANQGPLGGTGDILGGPIKPPQGAL